MWRQFAEYSGLAIAMPIATVLGYAFGRWLDATLSTSFLWLVGLLFGIASGFTQLVRKAMKDSSFGAK
jgi:F0F1-type ATP synthase assembly protein I